MKTWLTSDYHFGHAKVIIYSKRPFASEGELSANKINPETVTKMNEILIKNWNEHVKPGDRVIFNGDFSMSATYVERVVPRLNGNIELYLGNHDYPHPSHDKGKRGSEMREKWTTEYLKSGFKEVHLEGKLEVNGVANFRLYHLPYYDPEDKHADGTPRHFKERLTDDGVPLLCGHVHERWLVKFTPKGTIQINVGVDAPEAPWSGQFRPASLEEVVEVYLKHTKSVD